MRGSARLALILGACASIAVEAAEPLAVVTDGPIAEKALALYEEHFKFHDQPPLQVATIDVNDDKLNDMLVFIDNGGFCGSTSKTDSCVPLLFLNKGWWGWEQLDIKQGPSTGDWTGWSMLDEVVDGYHVLVGPEVSGPVKYGWTGDAYRTVGPAD